MIKRSIERIPLPAEHTEDEIHDEERAEHHHGDEVAELPRVPHGVLDLPWPERGTERRRKEERERENVIINRRDLSSLRQGLELEW